MCNCREGGRNLLQFAESKCATAQLLTEGLCDKVVRSQSTAVFLQVPLWQKAITHSEFQLGAGASLCSREKICKCRLMLLEKLEEIIRRGGRKILTWIV